MKSTYYDLVDRYYSGFCGSGDEVEVRNDSVSPFSYSSFL